MKVFMNVLKVLAVLAAVAGIIFVIVKYGDKIVSWVRDHFGQCCNSFRRKKRVDEDAPMMAEDNDFEG